MEKWWEKYVVDELFLSKTGVYSVRINNPTMQLEKPLKCVRKELTQNFK